MPVIRQVSHSETKDRFREQTAISGTSPTMKLFGSAIIAAVVLILVDQVAYDGRYTTAVLVVARNLARSIGF
jgi:hypothetical protein